MTHIKVVKTLIAVLAATAFGACSDSYPGLSYDSLEQSSSQGQTGTTDPVSRDPLDAIVLSTNTQGNFPVKSQTRGIGAFDPQDTANVLRIWQAPFYVFAFRDGKYDKSNNIELLSEPDFSRWVYAKSNTGSSSSDNLNFHCLLDGDDYYYGLKTHFNNGQLVPEYNGVDYRNLGGLTGYQRFYYSSANAEVPYNFFAYYIDDIKITNLSTARQTDRVAYNIEIDGSQDLMCGKADLMKEIKIAEGKDTVPREQSAIYKKWKSLSQNERTKISGIGGYCTFAGHRGIHPTIDLKYQLARLKIECIPASKSAKDTRVLKLGIMSRYKGTLTVASRNVEEVGVVWDNDIDTLYMQDIKKVGDKLVSQPMATTEIKYDPSEESYIEQEEWEKIKTITPLGSSLMVVPADSYYIKMVLEKTEKGKNFTYTTKNILVTLKNEPKTFSADKEYKVKVLIKGLEEPEIYARPIGWGDGGDIYLEEN